MRIISNARHASARGSALILAVGYLAVLTISATAFLTLLNRGIETLSRDERRQVCLNLAEAGIDTAVAALRAQGGAYAGERDTALGDGWFSVEVEAPAGGGAYRIVSRARLENGTWLAVAADVALGPDGTARVLRWEEVKP